MERIKCSSNAWTVANWVYILLCVPGIVFTSLTQPRDEFQYSNCTSICPSYDNCTVSENGTVTCNTTDGSDSFSGSVYSSSRTAGYWRTALMVVSVFMILLFPAWFCIQYCYCRSSNKYSPLAKKDQEEDLSPQDIQERMEVNSHMIGGDHSCATDELKSAAPDDEKHHIECHAIDDLETFRAGHLGSVERRHLVDFGTPAPGHTAQPKCVTECHSEFVHGQDSHRSRPPGAAWQPLTDPPQRFRTHPEIPSPPLCGTALDDTAQHTTVAGSFAIVPDGEGSLSPPLSDIAIDDAVEHTTVAGSWAVVPDGEAALSPPLSDTALDDTAKHTTAAESLALLPDGEAPLTPPLSDTVFDDTAKHTTAAGSLAIVPDGEAALSRRHGPTESSLHIATHNTAIPPVVIPRPFPTRPERSILFTPEIVVVPDEIMTSSNASKLFRRCTRLHDHLESLMELDIISPQLCCQVTAECQSHGNMSGLALLYRQVKQVGNEVRFLTELRAHREEMANCTSSIGSDEAGGAASRLSETASPCSSATSLDSASAISLLRGHEMLMWVQALDNLEDLIYPGILTVYQYAYIVDLVRHDWRISALMQIVNGCRKLARLQRFLATLPTTTTPTTTTPTPPRRGPPQSAGTAAGVGRSTQQ